MARRRGDLVLAHTPFSQFNRGRKDLLDVAKELSGGRDVVVVVDEKIRALGRGFGKNKDDGDDGEKGGARDVAERTAEVIRGCWVCPKCELHFFF